jgi:hypothetical protein
MGAEGRRRIEQQLAWKYEAPKLVMAYKTACANKRQNKGGIA